MVIQESRDNQNIQGLSSHTGTVKPVISALPGIAKEFKPRQLPGGGPDGEKGKFSKFSLARLLNPMWIWTRSQGVCRRKTVHCTHYYSKSILF